MCVLSCKGWKEPSLQRRQAHRCVPAAVTRLPAGVTRGVPTPTPFCRIGWHHVIPSTILSYIVFLPKLSPRQCCKPEKPPRLSRFLTTSTRSVSLSTAPLTRLSRQFLLFPSSGFAPGTGHRHVSSGFSELYTGDATSSLSPFAPTCPTVHEVVILKQATLKSDHTTPFVKS